MTADNQLLDFARAVRDMQNKQKIYFQTRQKELLFDAIQAEKKVAKMVKEILPDNPTKDKRQLEFNFNQTNSNYGKEKNDK